MSGGDLVFLEGCGFGMGSEELRLPHTYGAYIETGCPEAFSFPSQHFRSNHDHVQGYTLDPISPTIMMPVFDVSPKASHDYLHQQTENGVGQSAPSAATEHLDAPAPPPKRGRGRPRLNDTTPRSRKKFKASLPTPPTSQGSPPELSPKNTRIHSSERSNTPPLVPPTLGRHESSGDWIDRRRDRNREAAQKCRTRKHQSTQRLVADVAAAEAINESLRRESNVLREETLLLKNMVLQHGSCDCAYVQAYIKNAASKLSQDSSSQPQAPLHSSGVLSTHRA